MKNPIFKLIPGYGEMVTFLMTILLFGGFMTALFNLIYTVIFVLVILALFFLLFRKTGTLYFFENHIVLKAYYGRKEKKFDYEEIDVFTYRFGGVRGTSSLTVRFKSPILNIKEMAYDDESVPQLKRIAAILKIKNIRFEVIPLEMRSKIMDDEM